MERSTLIKRIGLSVPAFILAHYITASGRWAKASKHHCEILVHMKPNNINKICTHEFPGWNLG
jgi:hypothetical protein